jgi:type VI secretion system protein ImpI
MGLTLTIENQASLPDGGPLSVSVQGKRGIDIGRDQYLDWTLPDPSRFISGKHCEVRWHDDGYWLHDVSLNGTFLDGADSRLKAPHRLRNGDRFAIGQYIIVAAVDGEGSDAGGGREAPPASAPQSYEDLWSPSGEAAPPMDPKQFKSPRDLKPVHPDFLDWAIDVPGPYAASSPPPSSASPRGGRDAAAPWEAAPAPATDRSWPPSTPKPLPSSPDRFPPPRAGRNAAALDPAPAPDDISWHGPPKPPPPAPEIPPVPNPRRPVWVSNEPEGPWAAAPFAAPRASPEPAASMPAVAQPRAATSGPPAPFSRVDNAALMDFVRLFAQGAGLPEDALAGKDPAELAEQLGQLMRLVAENVKQLLEARQMAKRLARSSNQTMIQALNNNPLKFTASAEEALRIMFGPPTRSYLDARRALAQSFDDLKAHQVRTFSAMQQALRLMLGELDPEVIENTTAGDRGLAAMVGSRKARLWDIYVARWQARTQSHSDGMLNAFMDYFAECYDRGER